MLLIITKDGSSSQDVSPEVMQSEVQSIIYAVPLSNKKKKLNPNLITRGSNNMLNNIKNTINLKLSLCQRISSLFRLLLDMTEPFQKAKYLHTHRASKNSSYCTLTRLLIIIPFKLCTLFELGKIVFVIALI